MGNVMAPAGFPACHRCPYLSTVDPPTCLSCCCDRFPRSPRPQCPVCDRALRSRESCPNDLCGRADRWFSIVWSIGPHLGEWREVIAGYKYREETSWAPVLGRILVAYLDDHMPWFDDFDFLVPMPAFTGNDSRRPWDHIGRVAAIAAQLAGPRWDFRPEVIVKERETPPLTGMARPARRKCAEGPLRRSLRVTDPASVRGRRILVIDDVFTEGSTLREVARALIRAGADEVAGLALARQPGQLRGPMQGPT